MDTGSILLLMLAAFSAGWIDAVVGGGGLIQLPALLLMPGVTPVQALATNKFAAVFGTGMSSLTYYRSQSPELRLAVPMASVALIGAAGGASIAVHLPREIFLPIILVALAAVAIVTVMNPNLGTVEGRSRSDRRQVVTMVAIGLVIGLYDGVLGPGTGTFLIFAMAGLLGFVFLKASAYAKITNFATNLGALMVFIPFGAVMWKLGALMAISNMAGSFVGSRTAIKKGNGFIRVLLLVVVAVLIAKLGWDFILSVR